MDYLRAVCESATIAMSKEKQTPSVKIRFKAENGEILYHDLWLTDKCFDRSMDVLRGVFGWFGTNVHDFFERHDLLTGIEVELAVEWEDYNGKDYLKVRFVNPAGGNPDAVTQIDAETARKIGEQLRGKIMLYDQKKKQGQGAATASPAKPAVGPKPVAGPPVAPKAPEARPNPVAKPVAKPKVVPEPPSERPYVDLSAKDEDDDLPF